MPPTNPFKLAALITGVSLFEAGVFACYLANVWQHPIALCLIVLPPVTILVITYQREHKWFNTANSITGTIISRQRTNLYGFSREVHTIAYTVQATGYTYHTYLSPYAPLPSIGESVQLFYQASNPAVIKERAVLIEKIAPWITLTLGAIGLVMMALHDSTTLLALTNP